MSLLKQTNGTILAEWMDSNFGLLYFKCRGISVFFYVSLAWQSLSCAPGYWLKFLVKVGTVFC